MRRSIIIKKLIMIERNLRYKEYIPLLFAWYNKGVEFDFWSVSGLLADIENNFEVDFDALVIPTSMVKGNRRNSDVPLIEFIFELSKDFGNANAWKTFDRRNHSIDKKDYDTRGAFIEDGKPIIDKRFMWVKERIVIKAGQYDNIESLLLYNDPRVKMIRWFMDEERGFTTDRSIAHQYFYERLKDTYLDYYLVFSEMGYSDMEALEMIKEEEWDVLFRQAKHYLRVRAQSKMGEAGMIEGNNTALMNFWRNLDDDTVDDEMMRRFGTLKHSTAKEKEIETKQARRKKPTKEELKEMEEVEEFSMEAIGEATDSIEAD